MNAPAANAPAATVTATEVVLPGLVEPSGLRRARRELPPPTAGQALVRVESTAVSFAESAMRRGRYYGQPPFPFVAGYDLVGVVGAVGPGVSAALAGRRVAALTKTGGWATAALLTAADLVEVPEMVGADEAETLILNGVTAYQMLHRSAKGFYNVWAGPGKPDSAKRDAFRARLRTDLTYLFGLLPDGVLTAKIAARYPLAEVAAAMELAESSGRTALGKIILVP
jgi:NADPH:quinone reductase-like Zn-dependent oxidoreductase